MEIDSYTEKERGRERKSESAEERRVEVARRGRSRLLGWRAAKRGSSSPGPRRLRKGQSQVQGHDFWHRSIRAAPPLNRRKREKRVRAMQTVVASRPYIFLDCMYQRGWESRTAATCNLGRDCVSIPMKALSMRLL